MDGIFIRKKIDIWLVLLLPCGILFVALYIFLNMVDSEATSDLRIFLVMGISCELIGILSALMNHGAYIHVEKNAIKAKSHATQT